MAEKSIKRAALFNMGGKYAAAGIHLLYSIILARILAPDDYGIVSIAQVFVTFFNLFADMGLGAAVIQRQDLNDKEVSGLFGFTVLLALGLGALFFVLGWPLAYIYDTSELVGVCRVLSLSVLFATMNTIPNALLMKSKRFLAVGLRQVVAALAASAIGIGAALYGANYYAITIYSVSNSLIVFLWNYLPHRLVPRFRGMIAAVRKVFSYSADVFGFNLINYFSRNLDNLLIGYFFGTTTLGNYSKAYQLMQYPQTYLTGAVTPVLHPMLAERQDDPDYVYKVFLKTAKILSLLGVFISVFCFFCADEFIAVVYGDQWGDAVPCFRFLAVSIWSQMICGTSGTMFQVLNRTREQLERGIIQTCVILVAILAGVASGSVANVALLVGLAYYTNFVLLGPFLIRRAFGRKFTEFLRELLPDLCIAACLCVTYWLLGFLPISAALPLLAVKLVVGAAVYLVLLVATGQLQWFLPVLPSSLKSKIPAWALKGVRG